VWFPLLAGLPQLEILILSHNSIKTLKREMLDDEGLPELKTLDLSSNQIDIKVSDLNGVLELFESKFKLTNLQFKDNPFCNFFSEYQMLTVYYLQNLERLDDLDLEKVDGLSKELTKQAMTYFGFKKKWAELGQEERKEYLEDESRKKKFEKRDVEVEERKRPLAPPKSYDTARRNPRVPEITDLAKLLDDAISDPRGATTYITLAFEDACHLMKGGADQLRKSLDARKGQSMYLDSFVHSALILVERYPESRMMLLKMIGKFSLVTEAPMQAIANLALGDGAPMDEIMAVLKDNVLQELARPLTLESFKFAILGLSHFSVDSDELADALYDHDLVPTLCTKLKPMLKNSIIDNKDALLQSALLSVLRCAVQKRENATNEALLGSDGICDDLAARVGTQREFRDADATNTAVYLNITDILCRCISEDCHSALSSVDAGYPKKLVELAYGFIFGTDKNRSKNDEPDNTSTIQGVFCRKVGAIIDVITAIMSDQKHMNDLLTVHGKIEDSELMKLILKAPAETSADPVILAASLDCCRRILEKAPCTIKAGQGEALCLQYLRVMVHVMQLDKTPNNILPYLESKKFKDMYRRCLTVNSNTPGEELAFVTAQVPDLGGCTNKTVHHSVAKIVQFLGVFTRLEDDAEHPCYDVAKDISQKMNAAGRDRLLLKLLEIPSQQVRDVVIECMKNVNAAQLEDEELEQMFEMLNPDDVKKEEYLMGQILGLFLNIIQDTDTEADVFREKHAKEVLEKSFEILVRNAERNTHGVDEDEQQKAELSMKAVELFFYASKQKHVRKHMRSQDFTAGFKQILLNEEKYNSPKVQDINLEISWTGRQVENLMVCLAGSDHVSPHKRQGFRLLNRVAEVMEGGSDSFKRFDMTARERADMEAKMWNDRKMKTQMMYADDVEYADRTHQQQSFVSFHGITRLLKFLEDHKSAIKKESPHDDDTFKVRPADFVDGEDQVKAASHFFKQVQRDAQAEVVRVEQAIKKEFNRDQEVEIKLDDEEEEVLENYESLLRDKYMQAGWQTSDTQKAIGFCIPPRPRQVELRETYHIPGTEDEICIVYPLAALLRAIYALLLVPSVERLRLETIQLLREVDVQTRLIALMHSHGSLVDCNIGAKYLRVMSWALRMANDQTVMRLDKHTTEDHQYASDWPEDYQYCLGVAVNASFAAHCLKLLTPMLANMGRGYLLTKQQQALCVEAVRMLAVVSHGTRFIKVTKVPGIQDKCLETLLSHFIDMGCVQSIMLCLLYDMQVTSGSNHGAFINAKYHRSSMERQGLRELCCDTLVNIIHLCPRMRYSIYEMFYTHEVHGRVQLRVSFLNELISRVEQSKYVVAMDALLKERFVEPGERILRCAEVDLPLERQGTLFSSFSTPSLEPQMMVITSKRFLIMERPKHGLLTRKCGHCPPESFCPVGPGIANSEKKQSYADISRIIRGIDSQMLIIGWIERSIYGDRISGENFDIYICHRSDVRREIVDTLSTLTGPDVEYRVEPQRDTLIKQSIEKRINSPIVCMSFAYLCSFKKGEYRPDGKMLLYILSESTVSEVAIKWDEWMPPFETSMAPDVSDEEGEKMQLDHEYDPSDPTVLADETVTQHKDRLMTRHYQTHASDWLTGGHDERPGLQKNSIWRNSAKPDKNEKVTMKVEGADGTKGYLLNGMYEEVGRVEVARDESNRSIFRRKFQQTNGKCIIYFKPDKSMAKKTPQTDEDVIGSWMLNNENSTEGCCYELVQEEEAEALVIPWTPKASLKWKLHSSHKDPSAFIVAPTVSFVSKAEKVKDDRKEAHRKDADRRCKKAKTAAGDPGGNLKQVQQNLLRKARSHIFESWRNWPIDKLNKIEFVSGEQPVLQLGFNSEVANGSSPVPALLTIRFLDDVARERWRKGLAYILNKSDTAAQWQRKWDEQVLT